MLRCAWRTNDLAPPAGIAHDGQGYAIGGWNGVGDPRPPPPGRGFTAAVDPHEDIAVIVDCAWNVVVEDGLSGLLAASAPR